MKLGRPPRAGEAAGNISIRVTSKERSQWKKAAGKQPLSNWIQDVCNLAAVKVKKLRANGPKTSGLKVQVCKFCGLSLAGISPIKPFSPIYNRMCPVRDYDPCERKTA